MSQGLIHRLVAPRGGLFLLLVFGGLFAFSPSALANTYTPTRTDDPTPNGCKPHNCSLREAITKANDHPGSDKIVLRGGRTYKLSILPVLGSDDDNLSGDLDILNSSLLITSNSSKPATVNAEGIDRVFDLVSGSGSFKRIRIRGGDVGSEDGGGVSSHTTAGPGMHLVESRVNGNKGNFGGGIYTIGHLTIRKSKVLRNSGVDGAGVAVDGGTARIKRSIVKGNTASSTGGGIEIYGPTTINRSTVAGNSAVGSDGGGVYVSSGSFKATNSTISGNHTGGDGGGVEQIAAATLVNDTLTKNTAAQNGGGINNDAGPATNLNAVTIARNSSGKNGGGIDNESGIGNVKNSLIALNEHGGGFLGPDCHVETGSLVSRGHNLIGDTTNCSGIFGGASHDITNVVPKLGKLADYGGPTKTIALLRHSPAINHAGKSAPSHDQRGVKRDKHPDIGAFERR